VTATRRLHNAFCVGGQVRAYLAVRIKRVFELVLLLDPVKFRLGEETTVVAVFVLAEEGAVHVLTSIVLGAASLRRLRVVLFQELLDAAQDSIESGSSQAEEPGWLLPCARRQRSSHVFYESDFSEVVTFVESPDKLKGRGAIWLLFLEAALDLAFLDDIEVVALVILVEDVLTRVHCHHFEPINQSEFVELLQALKELNLVEVLKTNVASADRVLSDNVLEDITREDPGLAISDGRD